MQGEFLLPKFGSSARDPLLGDLCLPNLVIVIGQVHGWTQGGVYPPNWFLPFVLSGSIGEWLFGYRIGRLVHPW